MKNFSKVVLLCICLLITAMFTTACGGSKATPPSYPYFPTNNQANNKGAGRSRAQNRRQGIGRDRRRSWGSRYSIVSVRASQHKSFCVTKGKIIKWWYIWKKKSQYSLHTILYSRFRTFFTTEESPSAKSIWNRDEKGAFACNSGENIVKYRGNLQEITEKNNREK